MKRYHLNALDNALVVIANKYGNDTEKWLWGDFHKAYFKDDVIGKYPLISYLTNLVFEFPGGDYTLSMNRPINTFNFQFNVNYGSTLRVILDFSDENNSFLPYQLDKVDIFYQETMMILLNIGKEMNMSKYHSFQDDITKEKESFNVNKLIQLTKLDVKLRESLIDLCHLHYCIMLKMP